MTTTNRRLLLIDAAHEPGPILARAFARQGLAVTAWSANPTDDVLEREDGVLWAPQATVPEVLAAHQPFDAVIFNIPAVDEGTLMASGPPGAVADAVADDTSRFFSTMQAVLGAMVATGRGQIWQMVLEDSFGYYVSIPYSPVSHGIRIGCMRAIAKEVTMFKVLVNAISTISRDQTVDGDHGRIETRMTTVIHDVAWLQERHRWPGLKAIVMVESIREIDGKSERETRFYITSLLLPATQLGSIVRSHWAVENSLHWVMDMIFRDDECRVRTEHAPANFTTIKHMAHNLLRRAPGKDSLRLRRKVAAWDDDFLASIITA